MEETFLLSTSNRHMTTNHAVQSCTVSDEDEQMDNDSREQQLLFLC